MKLENVKHIGVVGGGIMGAGIAQILAAAGFTVTIRDITDQVIDDTRHALVEGKWGVKRAVERGKISQARRKGNRIWKSSVPSRASTVRTWACAKLGH